MFRAKIFHLCWNFLSLTLRSEFSLSLLSRNGVGKHACKIEAWSYSWNQDQSKLGFDWNVRNVSC